MYLGANEAVKESHWHYTNAINRKVVPAESSRDDSFDWEAAVCKKGHNDFLSSTDTLLFFSQNHESSELCPLFKKPSEVINSLRSAEVTSSVCDTPLCACHVRRLIWMTLWPFFQQHCGVRSPRFRLGWQPATATFSSKLNTHKITVVGWNGSVNCTHIPDLFQVFIPPRHKYTGCQMIMFLEFLIWSQQNF